MLVFFIDRNLESQKFITPLLAAALEVARHREYFQHDARDDEWIPQVAARGWIIVTADRRIRLRSHEKQAVLLTNARVIGLTMGKATFEQLAANFVRTMPRIERFIAQTPAPFFAVLSRPNDRDFLLGKPGKITIKKLL